MTERHLDESAELFALGALEPDERLAAEQHLATCDACVARVAEADSVVAALAATLPARAAQPQRPQPSRAAWLGAAAAVAAVFVVGFGLLGWQLTALRSERAQTTVALAMMVHSHFLHVAMTKRSPDAPNAKILFARDGKWIYVIVDRAGPPVHLLVGGGAGAMRDAGVLHAGDGVATLFVPDAGRPTLASLEDASGVTNTAYLAYP